MNSTPDDDPTIVPLRPREASGFAVASRGSGNALPLGTRLDEFEVKGLVGEGGFGIVYLAHDHVLGRDVALKEYMPSAIAARADGMTVIVRAARYEDAFQAGLRSFINEARLLARFDHPSLVKVHRFWDANGTAYMAMPFYQGVTLKALLKSRGAPPDEAWLRDLLTALADALDLLHADHCFHRDVAPDNILMLDGRLPLLLDFGAARRVIGEVTHDLTAILKPGYAPVEQYAEGPSMKQGAWTDIYALASVVYYAIMGRAPAPSVARLIADPMVPLEVSAAGRYSATFLRGIDKALSVRPEDRPQTMQAFCALLGLRAPRSDTDSMTVGPITLGAPADPELTRPADEATLRRPFTVTDNDATVVRKPVAAAPAHPRRKWKRAALAAGLLLAIGATYVALKRGTESPSPAQDAASAPASLPTPAASPTPEAARTIEAAPTSVPPQPVSTDHAAPATESAATPEPPPTRAKSIDDSAPSVAAPLPAGSAGHPTAAKAAPHTHKQSAAGTSTAAHARAAKSDCSDILQRASLGEALSPAEQQKLRDECR